MNSSYHYRKEYHSEIFLAAIDSYSIDHYAWQKVELQRGSVVAPSSSFLN
jgi:hypothetical protein